MKLNRWHFLITAGGTREYIDPVRFISNASSGRMGYELAKAALKASHKVTLITTVKNPQFKIQNSKFKIAEVETAEQMFKAVKKYFRQCSCLIMAAAVSDYKPSKRSKIKIKKSKSDLVIRLKPTVDILKWAGKNRKKGQIVVGFALEDRNLRGNAEEKLRSKKLDMIIANNPTAIGAENTTVQIKAADGRWIKISAADKKTIAARIIRTVEILR
jgi:phosphopantothenoylcysteine decarboxylase/phosphopantothenate--cysteine ligase